MGMLFAMFAIIELFAGKRLLSTSGTRAYVITEDIYRVICLRLFLLFLLALQVVWQSRRFTLTRAHTRPTVYALRASHSFDREGTHHVPLPCH